MGPNLNETCDVTPEVPPSDNDLPNTSTPLPEVRKTTVASPEDEFGLYSIKTRYEFVSAAPANRAVEISPSPMDEPEVLQPMPTEDFSPFPNKTIFLLCYWHWMSSSQKTVQDLERLRKIILDPDFDMDSLRRVNLKALFADLASEKMEALFNHADGWVSTPISIPVPLGHLDVSAPNKAEYHLEFFRRSLVGIIQATFSSREKSSGFAFEPEEKRCNLKNGGPHVTVYGELYWSKSFRDAHDEVQLLRREPGDEVPRAVAALMFWSDGMAATTYGNKKIWPAYLQFGNQSKLLRRIPDESNLHHIAHIPSVRCPMFYVYFNN